MKQTQKTNNYEYVMTKTLLVVKTIIDSWSCWCQVMSVSWFVAFVHTESLQMIDPGLQCLLLILMFFLNIL